MKQSAILLVLLAGAAHPGHAAAPLSSGRWTVAAVNGQPTGGGERYHLTLDRYGKGTFTGGFGCNSMQGRYRIANARLTITMAGMTEMACGGPEGHFETLGLRIIDKPMRIERQSGARIRLHNAGGSILLDRSAK